MRKLADWDFATWLNTLIGIAGLLVPLIAWLISKKYFIEVVAVVELLLIIYLIILNTVNKQKYLTFEKYSLGELGDKELFENFYSSEVDSIKERVYQLNSGYLLIFGTEVRHFQVQLLELLIKTKKRYVRATDLTENPGILLSRQQYMRQNRRFVDGDGVIKRIFLIDENKLREEKFRKDLYLVFEVNKQNGVIPGLYFLSLLNANERQDFIIYDGFAVVVEGRQADESYTVATSSVYFKRSQIEAYSKIFEKIWDGQLGPSCVKILEEFYRNANQCVSSNDWSTYPVDQFISTVNRMSLS